MQKFSERKGLIAKIHIAKKELALTDESYRDLLRKITGKETCSEMRDGELDKVLTEFRRLGFKNKTPPKRAGSRKLASQPQAKLLRALWIKLYKAGVVKDPSEDALISFFRKNTGVDDLQWMTPADANVAIKALKGWMHRAGVPDEE